MRFASLLLLSCCTPMVFAQQPVKIAVVRTWGDLTDQPLLTLKNGSRVRVGLEAREVTRNSAFLVYALLDGIKWQTQGSDVLGPLQVELSPDDRPFKRYKAKPSEHALREKDSKQLLAETDIIYREVV